MDETLAKIKLINVFGHSMGEWMMERLSAPGSESGGWSRSPLAGGEARRGTESEAESVADVPDSREAEIGLTAVRETFEWLESDKGQTILRELREATNHTVITALLEVFVAAWSADARASRPDSERSERVRDSQDLASDERSEEGS